MTEYTESTAFIDLKAQQQEIRIHIDEAIAKVLDHGQYIMGPEVKELEDKLSQFCGSKFTLTCANGTDALTIAMMSLDVSPGDAIFVPSFTYVATAETAAQLGATPFFVDVDESTFNMDSESLKQAIYDSKIMGLKPKIVIPVDLFGQAADFDRIDSIAKNENLSIIIDAAQSFGGSYDGKKVGSYGDITTTSFFPAKPLGCYGDGGAIFTQNEELASKIDSIRLHGRGQQKYENIRVGVNSRLDTIQAAILIEKLKIFPQEIKRRNHIAGLYTENLKEIVKTPLIISKAKSAWAQYTLSSDNRDSIRTLLQKNNIPTVIYYPLALSEQTGFSKYPKVSSGLNNSENLPKKVFSLPMHPYLKDEFPAHLADLLKETI